MFLRIICQLHECQKDYVKCNGNLSDSFLISSNVTCLYSNSFFFFFTNTMEICNNNDCALLAKTKAAFQNHVQIFFKSISLRYLK